MEKKQFYEAFYQALEKEAQAVGAELKWMDVLKNNEMLKGIRIQFKKGAAAPVIYPGRYIQEAEEGLPVEFLAARAFREAQEGTKSINKLFDESEMDHEHAEIHLRCAVMGYENNQELLKHIPHERILDLALYARWDFGNGASAALTDQGLAALHMTKEEALCKARKNTAKEASVRSLESIIEGMFLDSGMDEEMAASMAISRDSTSMYVLTTREGYNGAGLLAAPDVLKEIHEKLGDDFYILPSSIHEVMILSKSHSPGTVEDLAQMVRTVNQSEVKPADRLSDQVYEFDGRKLSLAGTKGMEREEKQDGHRHSR